MTPIRVTVSVAVLGALVAITTLLVGSACSPTAACTPDSQGFTEAERVSPRALPGTARTETACVRPRVEVIASEEDLRQLYSELHITIVDGGTIDAGTDAPNVDFSNERVIVREGPADEAVSWMVVRGEVASFGLLYCATVARKPSCVVEVYAIPALVERAEGRTCDPVGCGVPLRAPTRQL